MTMPTKVVPMILAGESMNSASMRPLRKPCLRLSSMGSLLAERKATSIPEKKTGQDQGGHHADQEDHFHGVNIVNRE